MYAYSCILKFSVIENAKTLVALNASSYKLKSLKSAGTINTWPSYKVCTVMYHTINIIHIQLQMSLLLHFAYQGTVGCFICIW